MQPLDEKETTMVFEKLFKFTGPNLKHLLERPAVEGPDQQPGRYCLRLHKNRIYYASESLVRRATAVARPRLAGVGTPIGKFTHSSAFHLAVHALDLLAAASGSSLTPSAPSSSAIPCPSPPSRTSPRTPRPVMASWSCLWPTYRSSLASPQDCMKADTNAMVVLH